MRWIVVGAAVAALALALAGCGGSSNSGNDATADTVATDTSASTEDTSTVDISTVDTSTEDTSTEDTSTVDTSTENTSTETGDLAGLSGKCADLAKASQAFGAAIASSGGGSDDLDTTADAYKALAQKAPDEIKDDFEVLAGVMSDYAKAFRDAGLKPGETPTPKQIAKLVVLSRTLNTTGGTEGVSGDRDLDTGELRVDAVAVAISSAASPTLRS